MEIKKRIEDMIAYARTWIGTPYVHQGRQRGVGCDCAGVLVGMADKFGHQPEDMAGYSPIPRQDQLQALIGKQMESIEVADIAPGDIVLMTLIKSGKPHHIGFITDYGGALGVIHCNQLIGKVVEHVLDDKWRSRIKLAFRFKDIFVAKNIDKTFDLMTGKKE